MLSAKGFQATWKYIELFKQGLICTLSLSALTVIFGFLLALVLALCRLSDIRPFRFLATDREGHLRPQGFLLSNQIIGELLEIQNNSHPIIRT